MFSRLQAAGAPDQQDLQTAAQLALQVEFTTIPTYLNGLYSISDTSSYAYQTLRSVVMEEMFHVNQAANILVAMGGLPKFTGEATPKYPGYLPQANPETTPYLGLYRASPDVFSNVYEAIETPAAFGAPPQGDNYDSIAQLYAALVDAVDRADIAGGNPFNNDGPGRQRTNIYLGKFGGNVEPVKNMASFKQAVQEIVEQGEGTVPPQAPLKPIEQYGSYNHYGKRTDGTYGPIIGTPYELSHFMKFRSVAMKPEEFPATYPIISNPNAEDYTNPDARKLSFAFDLSYTLMLHAFEQSFKNKAADPYFSIVLGIMHDVLPNLARALMQTPALTDGDPSVGPNAAPSWMCLNKGDVSIKRLVDEMDTLLKEMPRSLSIVRPLLAHALTKSKEIECSMNELGLK
ncbi:ferritin-like domain-containing protein [Bacterioplanes sanyensis]|uniref:ferritin-like domain-containing protein n=1 Tax=Bacterioplanes sanyensis TaxID=1249553 RepID=UPI0012FDC087|nr:ferritin-like domain-containing protein [Bacterioplanes sanyensis]